MAKDVTLTYNGPQVRVVELDRDLVDGDEIEVSPELAPKLLAAAGFREKGKRPPTESTDVASRSTLEARATELGLQLYPTETDEALGHRILQHGGRIEPGEVKPEPEPEPETTGKGSGD
jgi:hypothetical protein